MEKDQSDRKSEKHVPGKDGQEDTGASPVMQNLGGSGQVAVPAPENPTDNPVGGVAGIRTSLMNFNREKYSIQIPGEFDITHISDRILVCGRFWTQESNRKLHTINLGRISAFLNSNLKDSYIVWNLAYDSSTETYDTSVFDDQVLKFNFTAPQNFRIENIFDFCKSLHAWLLLDKKNVALIHCATGICPTGVLVACYLCYSRVFTNGLDALALFNKKRSPKDDSWVTPVALRYISYFSSILQCGGKVMSRYPMVLHKVVIGGLSDSTPASRIFIEIYKNGILSYNSLNSKTRTSRVVSKSSDSGVYTLTFKIQSESRGPFVVERDIQIFITHAKLDKVSKEYNHEILMSFCFHTGFITPGRVRAFSGDMDMYPSMLKGNALSGIHMDIELEAQSNLDNFIPISYEHYMQKGLLSCIGSINKHHHVSSDPNIIRSVKGQFSDMPSQLIAFALKRKQNDIKRATEFLRQLKRKGVVSFDLKMYKKSVDEAANRSGLSRLVNPTKFSTHPNNKAPLASNMDGIYMPSNIIFDSYLEPTIRRPSMSTLKESRKLLGLADETKPSADSYIAATYTSRESKVPSPELPLVTHSEDVAEKRRNLVSLIRDLDSVAMDADKLADYDNMPNTFDVSSGSGKFSERYGDTPSGKAPYTTDIAPVLSPTKRSDSFGPKTISILPSLLKNSISSSKNDTGLEARDSNISSYDFLFLPEITTTHSSSSTLNRSNIDISPLGRSSSNLLEPIIQVSPSSEAITRQRSIEMGPEASDKSRLITPSKPLPMLGSRRGRLGGSSESSAVPGSSTTSVMRDTPRHMSFSMGVGGGKKSGETRGDGLAARSDSGKSGNSRGSSRKTLLFSTDLPKSSSVIDVSSRRRTNSPLLQSLSSLSLNDPKFRGSSPSNGPPGLSGRYFPRSESSVLRQYSESGSDVEGLIVDSPKSRGNLRRGTSREDAVKERDGRNDNGNNDDEHGRSSADNESHRSPPPPPPPSSGAPPPPPSSGTPPPPPSAGTPPPPPPRPISSNAPGSSMNNSTSQLSGSSLAPSRSDTWVRRRSNEIRHGVPAGSIWGSRSELSTEVRLDVDRYRGKGPPQNWRMTIY